MATITNRELNKERGEKVEQLLEMLTRVNPEQAEVKMLNVFDTFVKVGFEKGKLTDCAIALVTAVVMCIGIIPRYKLNEPMDSFVFLINKANIPDFKSYSRLDSLFSLEVARNRDAPHLEYLKMFMRYEPSERQNAARLIKFLNPELFDRKEKLNSRYSERSNNNE